MRRAVLICSAVVLAGCRRHIAPLPRPAEPIAAQLARAMPEMKGQHFRTLLDFENASDAVFVAGPTNGAPVITEKTAHTGRYALAAGSSLSFRVSPLLYGQKLPGPWTLLGVYLRGDVAGTVDVSCAVNGEVISTSRQRFAPGAWTLATVDLADTPQLVERLNNLGPDDLVTLRCGFSVPAVAVDDLLLMDNTARLVSTDESGFSGWTIARRGNAVLIDAPGRFNMRLDAAGERAWRIEEVNDLRTRLHSSGSDTRDLTVYVDGRSFWDGKYRSLAGKDPARAAVGEELRTPGVMTVADGLGRLDRGTPGDEDNDGFNERRGAYQLVATGPRLDCTLTPSKAAITWPVLEVASLPPGVVLATIDGRLIEHTTRLADGKVLIKLPVRLELPASVQISVR